MASFHLALWRILVALVLVKEKSVMDCKRCSSSIHTFWYTPCSPRFMLCCSLEQLRTRTSPTSQAFLARDLNVVARMNQCMKNTIVKERNSGEGVKYVGV